jgi:tRNA U34 5-methylaminomethyl-2-thiouridine-forming methyltransferase MnmC
MHNSPWEKETPISKYFNLLKINIELEKFNLKTQYDLIYFDAFSPNKQPELWTYNIFKKLYENLNTDGILITYCAKGIVKRTLKEVGFEIKSLAGPIGKREITQAKKK